jgi:hypothetical protein
MATRCHFSASRDRILPRGMVRRRCGRVEPATRGHGGHGAPREDEREKGERRLKATRCRWQVTCRACGRRTRWSYEKKVKIISRETILHGPVTVAPRPGAWRRGIWSSETGEMYEVHDEQQTFGPWAEGSSPSRRTAFPRYEFASWKSAQLPMLVPSAANRSTLEGMSSRLDSTCRSA